MFNVTCSSMFVGFDKTLVVFFFFNFFMQKLLFFKRSHGMKCDIEKQHLISCG